MDTTKAKIASEINFRHNFKHDEFCSEWDITLESVEFE